MTNEIDELNDTILGMQHCIDALKNQCIKQNANIIDLRRKLQKARKAKKHWKRKALKLMLEKECDD